MNEFTADRKQMLTFLATFGKDLEDISIRISEHEVEAVVGQMTHYLRARLAVTDGTHGGVTISDLKRLVTFLKACGGERVTIAQAAEGKTLHVTCGNSKLQLPSSTYVRSQREVGLVERLVQKSQDGMWTKWVNFPLDHSATVTTQDFAPVTQMAKVIGDKLSCRTEFSSSDGELTIRAGKGAQGKMFVRIPLHDAKGPMNAAHSTFGYWLPSLLTCLPQGEVSIHTGEDTVMVFRQEASGFLLIVMDQDYEED